MKHYLCVQIYLLFEQNKCVRIHYIGKRYEFQCDIKISYKESKKQPFSCRGYFMHSVFMFPLRRGGTIERVHKSHSDLELHGPYPGMSRDKLSNEFFRVFLNFTNFEFSMGYVNHTCVKQCF